MIVVDSGFAVFALFTNERLMVHAAPPIAKYTLGWSRNKAIDYFMGRGFKVAVYDLPW